MDRIFKDPVQEEVYKAFSTETFETPEEAKRDLLRFQGLRGQNPDSIRKTLDVLTAAGVIIRKKSFFRDVLKPVDMRALGQVFDVKPHRVGEVWYSCRHEHFNFTPDAKLAYTFRIDMTKLARRSVFGKSKDPLRPAELIGRYGFKRFDGKDQRSYGVLLGDNALPIKDRRMDRWWRSDEKCIVKSNEIKINGIFLTNAVEGSSEYDVVAVMLCKGTLSEDQSKVSPKEKLDKLTSTLGEKRKSVAQLVKTCVDAVITGERLPEVKGSQDTAETERDMILATSGSRTYKGVYDR